MLLAALLGFVFGFVGSVPVAGPIAVLVFTRGVDGRYREGLFLAFGAAIAEAAYAFLAFWGFAAFLAEHEFIIPLSRAGAAVILTGLGVVLARRRASPVVEREEAHGGSSFFLGFTLTALNPTLIATWAAAITTLFSTGWLDFSVAEGVPFAIASGFGIFGWFALLIAIMRRYRDRFKPQTLNRVVRVMGVFLIGIGIAFVVSFILYLRT